MIRARITGTGGFLPEKILTNKDIEAFCDTTDEWIVKRTGIRQRHQAEEGVGASDLATPAAQMALDDAGITAQDLDAIVCATVTPDQIAPSTSILVQSKLGADTIPAFDLNAACSGFLYGLASVRGFIETGMYRTVLLIGAETTMRLLDWDRRDTAVLFADGAGAVVVQGEEGENGVLAMTLGSDGRDAEILAMEGGGFKNTLTPKFLEENPLIIKMNGRELFKRAVITFEEASKKVLNDAGLKAEDVDVFIPHQANGRIIETARQRLGVDADKVVLNLDKVGNTVAASIPLALAEADRAGRVKPGDVVLMTAFGAGLTWGSAVFRW